MNHMVFCFFKYACISKLNFLAWNKMYTDGSIWNVLCKSIKLDLSPHRTCAILELSVLFPVFYTSRCVTKQVEIGIKCSVFSTGKTGLSQSEMMCMFSVLSEKAWDFRGAVSAHTPEVQQHHRWYGDWAGAGDFARSSHSCVSVSKNVPFLAQKSLTADRRQQTVNYLSFSKFPLLIIFQNSSRWHAISNGWAIKKVLAWWRQS